MINFNQYVSEKKVERLYLDILMAEQIRQDNITNWIVSYNEDDEEILVEKYISESVDEGEEDEDEAAPKKPKKLSKGDITGKLHELLVGYHLGGKHMEKHVNAEGDSPEEAHDKLKVLLDKHDPKEYDRVNARAKSAAADLKNHFDSIGHKIKHVSWTSKNGDIGRATGGKFNSTQNEDSSDIVVHSHHVDEPPEHVRFTGISLKKVDKNSPEAPLSNPGIKQSGPNAKANLDKHRAGIVRDYPTMPTTYTTARGKVMSHGAEKRKDWMEDQPADVRADIKKRNVTILQNTARGLADHLNSHTPEERRQKLISLLSARNPPMHKQPVHPNSTQNHMHYRHVTYGAGDVIKHKLITDVEKEYESRVSNPKVEAVARGGSVIFTNTVGTGDNAVRHEIARQDMKFSTQRDPHSSLVSSGKEMKLKPPKPPEDPNAPPKKSRSKKKVIKPLTPIPTANQSDMSSSMGISNPAEKVDKDAPPRKPRVTKPKSASPNQSSLKLEQIRTVLKQIRESRYA